MKAFSVVMKILAAAAAVVGAVYVAATYGDKIVAWAKKLLPQCPCCKEETEEAPVEETAEVEVAVEEAPAEEVPAEEAAPAEEEAPAVEEAEPVAEEADFEG